VINHSSTSLILRDPFSLTTRSAPSREDRVSLRSSSTPLANTWRALSASSQRQGDHSERGTPRALSSAHRDALANPLSRRRSSERSRSGGSDSLSRSRSHPRSLRSLTLAPSTVYGSDARPPTISISLSLAACAHFAQRSPAAFSRETKHCRPHRSRRSFATTQRLLASRLEGPSLHPRSRSVRHVTIAWITSA